MKTIALIVDMKDWAFDIEAKILKNNLKDKFDIDIYVSKDYDDNLFYILEDTKKYDIIHFFWRKLLLQLSTDEFKDLLIKNNYEYDDYINDISKKISTGIYDHLFLDEESIKLYSNVFNKYCNKYYTCSKKLFDIYNSIEEYKSPWGVIHDTYDSNLYDGGDRTRYKNKKDYLIIGWIGNSNWNIKYKDFKGFHTILNPVLDELIEEGYLIKKHFADKNIKFRTNEEMPAYYQEIDICIITSTEEGTPRPIIEAMASGVPLITTNVGIAEEALGPKQKEFIIGKRNDNNDKEIKKRLKEKIIEIYNDRNLLEVLSEENYKLSKENSIYTLKDIYSKYFDN